ncbi:MAG TPA: hypothetical protein VGR45_03950 [Stellaceae bacterium]|nr:hypothetical protein [Stellaceae bacterium]
MADPILERALAKRDAALREAADWEAFIGRYRQLAEEPAQARNSDQTPPPQRRPIERELAPDSELAKTIAITEAALEERGHPMPLDLLFNEVTKRGLGIGGKKPKDNYGARLYNSGRFRSISKKTGWWFKHRPLPASEEGDNTAIMETPNSSELFGASRANGAEPLNL